MEYENDDRGYGGESLPLRSEINPTPMQTTLPGLTRPLEANVAADEQRSYDREDDRDVRDDRRRDEDARARSASPDGRDRMDTRYVASFTPYLRGVY